MKAKTLVVLLHEGMFVDDKPLFKLIVEKFKEAGMPGVSVFKGIMGYGRHKGLSYIDPFHGHGDDPIMVIMVGSEEQVEKGAKIVKSLKEDLLVIVFDVEII
ncbi:hypothetical protein EYM_02455 [Ignicoccus islandicus DSM 13165]|uniref:Uncharacterized protein n=1 Tax=Ignicoccus islandicus DSM 13165 TaxID=940295 RepID=A0A0U3FKE1_9CREN|nr:DUF190 domain-containing protein [Ignicoccus islandicus]ALU12326.1 hypothetical protein EYM_02455 [Ignicoccus islandicus DSM 13165]